MSEERDPKTMLVVDEPMTEAQARSFTGVYRGIRYEIKTWPVDGYLKNSLGVERGWAHYLLINVDKQVPEALREGFWLKPRPMMFASQMIGHDYMEGPTANIEFHGGITFYEKIGGLEGGDRWVKLGCDYQHLWDEGQRYTEQSVLSEVKASIDSFWDDVCRTAPLARSRWDGKYYEASAAVENEVGK